MVAAHLGPSHDLARRLADLERKVAALASENALDNASANERDGTPGFVISTSPDGGVVLRVNHAEGGLGTDGQHPQMFRVGEFFTNGQSDGTGLEMVRPDGHRYLYVGRQISTSNPVFQWFDDSGNELLSADATANWGLAQPVIPWVAGAPSSTLGGTGWASTAATTWTTLFTGFFTVQHPACMYRIAAAAGSGISGNFRIQAGPAGGVLATVDSWSLTNANQYRDGGLSLGGAGVPYGATAANFGALWQVNLDAEVTAGASTVSMAPLLIAGRKS